MFIVENIPPRHVRVKYQLDSEHFIMCVFVMRISGNKVISNPELDVENRWYKILESRQTDLCSTSTIHVLVKYFGQIDFRQKTSIWSYSLLKHTTFVCGRVRILRQSERGCPISLHHRHFTQPCVFQHLYIRINELNTHFLYESKCRKMIGTKTDIAYPSLFFFFSIFCFFFHFFSKFFKKNQISKLKSIVVSRASSTPKNILVHDVQLKFEANFFTG